MIGPRAAPSSAPRGPLALGVALALACLGVALALAPAVAQAHHSILIREVRASALAPGSGFVELQAYRQGQNRIAGSELVVYDSTGLGVQEFPLDHDVPNSESQRTMLISGSDLAGVADFSFAGLGTALAPAGGAVCLPEASPPDCVSWGSFSGATLMPFPGTGSPAPAIPEGSSLTRTLARGCAMGLDTEDDSHNSAADFNIAVPSPSPNSAPASGRDCVPCAGSDATIIGSNGSEVLRGTPGRDVIAALAGADTVVGLGGNDLLCGGIGKDVIRGGAGRDKLVGGRGRDRCLGGAGRDSGKSCEVRKQL